jgi:hypothetical protein
VVLHLGLQNVRVVEGQTREVVGRQLPRGGIDLVLMKAVAPPPRALELARPFLAPGARVVLWREVGYAPEPELLRRGWVWEGGRPLRGFGRGPQDPALQLFLRAGGPAV